MQKPSFNWPTKEDYDMAMEAASKNSSDEDVKKGTIKRDNTGLLRYGGAGLYVALYHVDNFMVRCFCKTPQREPPHDILTRYQHIDEFTHRIHYVPSIVPVTYVKEGIKVNYIDRDGGYVLTDTQVLPLIKMPFIAGQSLGSFIFANRLEQERMNALCSAWIQLIHDLKQIQMAHGDLDLTNIIVTQDHNNAITLKVIDYDNTWIPELAGREQTEGGHEHFQHPAFNSKRTRPFDANMDRFAALVIYISMKAIAYYPNLYIELGADDSYRLLLSKKDYDAESKGIDNHITLLRKKQIPELEPLLAELSMCLHEKKAPRYLEDLLLSSAFDRKPISWQDKQSGNNSMTEPVNESLSQGMTEDVYYDYGRLSAISSPGPVVPITPDWSISEPNIPIPPSRGVTQEPIHRQVTVPNTIPSQREPIQTYNSSSQEQGCSARAILFACIILLVIVAIILAILFATHVISLPAPTHPNATLQIVLCSTMMRIVLYN